MSGDPATGAMEVPLIPVRMLNEYVYCPRLGYLMWVQGEFEHNAYTVEGVIRHRRVDKPKGKLPEQPPQAEEEAVSLHAQSVSLGSEDLGITAKIDLVEADGLAATPVDYKRSKRPHIAAGVYDPERVQLCAQGLLLREHGYACEGGRVPGELNIGRAAHRLLPDGCGVEALFAKYRTRGCTEVLVELELHALALIGISMYRSRDISAP